MADAAPTSSTTASISQDAPRILAFIFKRGELLHDGGASARDYGWDLIAGGALSARAEAAA